MHLNFVYIVLFLRQKPLWPRIWMFTPSMPMFLNVIFQIYVWHLWQNYLMYCVSVSDKIWQYSSILYFRYNSLNTMPAFTTAVSCFLCKAQVSSRIHLLFLSKIQDFWKVISLPGALQERGQEQAGFPSEEGAWSQPGRLIFTNGCQLMVVN